jgi:hypothetical protein
MGILPFLATNLTDKTAIAATVIRPVGAHRDAPSPDKHNFPDVKPAL